MSRSDPAAVLVPRPRTLESGGRGPEDLDRLQREAVTGTGPGSKAWEALEGSRPQDLGAEGFVLRIEAGSTGRALIAGADEAGVFYGRAALRQLCEAGAVRELTLRDEPVLAWRGVVEGFYGRPWSHRDRIEFLRFAGQVRLNNFVCAAKDDPYHRDRWRDPWPQAELSRIGELAREAEANHVLFTYALAPALSMRVSEDREHELLAAKAEQLYGVGVRSFALLFDDVPTELTDPGDVAMFGADAGASGAAHGLVCSRFRDGFLIPRGIAQPLAICPTDYAGNSSSPYRDRLAEALPGDALVMWTGSDIVVGEVSREDIDAAAASYRRSLVLWDNFPVNDFDRTRLFLGPLQGRTGRVRGSALHGISSNPMVEAAPSRFPLATVADWAWDPERYEPEDAARRALALVGGDEADALAPLIEACSSWPPSAPQSPGLEEALTGALEGDEDSLRHAEGVLQRLATAADGIIGAETHEARDALHSELMPWLATAHDVGTAGVLACRLLRRLQTEAPASLGAERDELKAAQAQAETHYPNVLRTIMPAFVHAVLGRMGLEQPVHGESRRILVLIGPNPAPGDRDLGERLTALGFAMTLATGLDPASLDADLVIVTRNASVEAAQTAVSLAVPVIIWGHLVATGLAAKSAVPLSQHSIDIVAPEHPLAAGLSGLVQVYRGHGKITWGLPAESGVVIAKGVHPDEPHPAIVYYPAGAELVDGSTAPAPRLTFFLGSEGLAPWLIAPEGHALLNTAVTYLLAAASSPAAPATSPAEPSRTVPSEAGIQQ